MLSLNGQRNKCSAIRGNPLAKCNLIRLRPQTSSRLSTIMVPGKTCRPKAHCGKIRLGSDSTLRPIASNPNLQFSSNIN
ncbi:hypothetical protein HanPI659440_Chr11g0440861 [Helianthus annuus]|nr:hypothetical protein HanPI659440_Chr11g0440861 [Helianthus annuus]